MSILKAALPLIVVLFAGACTNEDNAKAPVPIEVTEEAVGHYCGMLLRDHEGPKGQIHLSSRGEPVWFSSVRDTLAFTRLPEEPDDITAIYVNDMGRASNWANPEPGSWIEARRAWFVIESRRKGGMGGPEAIPFGDEDKAAAFAAANGGRVVSFENVPETYVLSSSTGENAGPAAEAPGHSSHTAP